MDFDRDLEATLRGRLAGSVLDVITAALDTLSEQIERRVMLAMKQGPLTTEQAMQEWYHKFALSELRAKLIQTASQGQNAARRISPQMMETTNAS